ncbi:MAG: SGNH/GDSL hydrolase family protein [Pirellula sp.]|jgi:hypothetical protein|nr:SGNH/GDSL hydrolase family protein [Pirellula sp.]
MAELSSRRFYLPALCVLVAIGAWTYHSRFVSIRIDGPEVDAKPFQTIWSDRKVLLVGIGDNITFGLGANSNEHSFFNRLRKNPSDELDELKGKSLSEVLPNLTSINFASSDSNSKQHTKTVEQSLSVQPADVFGIVILTTGGIDLVHSYGRSAPRECAMYGATMAQSQPWIASFRERLSIMLQLISERFPGGCEIYIADICFPSSEIGEKASIDLPPWKDGAAIHAAYNSVIHEVAQTHSNVHVVPINDVLLSYKMLARHFWKTIYNWSDPNHSFFTKIDNPNDQGYDVIRRTFLNAIADKTELRLGNTK